MQIPLQEKIAELEARIVKLEKEVKFLKENTITVIRHRMSEDALRKASEEFDKETTSAMDKMWAAADRFFKKVF